MLLLYINFGDCNPPYPALGSNIPSARRPGQRFHLRQCWGSSPSLRFVNRHTLRRAGWVAFTKVSDIAFSSDFCNNHSHPASPTSLYLTSPRPRPTRPRVPYLMSSSPSPRVPKSQVPTHASRCPRPLVPVPLLYTAIFFMWSILRCTHFLDVQSTETTEQPLYLYPVFHPDNVFLVTFAAGRSGLVT